MLTVGDMSNHNDTRSPESPANRPDPVTALTEALARGTRADLALAEAGIRPSRAGATRDVEDQRFRLSDHMQEVLTAAQLAQLRNGEEDGDIIGALRNMR